MTLGSKSMLRNPDKGGIKAVPACFTEGTAQKLLLWLTAHHFSGKLWNICLKWIMCHGSMGFHVFLLCRTGTELSICCRVLVNSSPLSKIFRLLNLGTWVPGYMCLAQSTVKVCWRGGNWIQNYSNNSSLREIRGKFAADFTCPQVSVPGF